MTTHDAIRFFVEVIAIFFLGASYTIYSVNEHAGTAVLLAGFISWLLTKVKIKKKKKLEELK